MRQLEYSWVQIGGQDGSISSVAHSAIKGIFPIKTRSGRPPVRRGSTATPITKNDDAVRIGIYILLTIAEFLPQRFQARGGRNETRRIVEQLYFDFVTGLRYFKSREPRPSIVIYWVETKPLF
jgi:hypothetical protein